MPSSLALILCILLVLYLLWLDHKQSDEVSFTFWIPTIWFLVLSSKPVSFWFSANSTTIEEGSPLDRKFLIVILLMGLIIIVKRRFHWVEIITKNVWLLLLLCYMLLSCLWADSPFISFRRWARELIAVIMILVIISEPAPWKAIESLLRRTFYILIPFSFLLIHFFGVFGRAYVHHSGDVMWIGATSHKNQLAQLCGVAIFFFLWMFIRTRQGSAQNVSGHQKLFEIFIITLAIIMMGGPYHSFTYSATATGSFIIGIMLLIFLKLREQRGSALSSSTLIILTLLIIFYGTITPFIGKLSLIDVSSLLGREENLTGRASVWNDLSPVAFERPFFGYGLGGFWTTTSRERYDISGAHNGFLDIILNLGFIGLIIYILFIVSIVRSTCKLLYQNVDWAVLLICYLVMALSRNITESTFISFNSGEMVLILCINLNLIMSKYKKQAETTNNP